LFAVWGFAILSVAVISALSVIGILLVPLMKHSVQFNRLLSFLVALAVGTLIGDALLHLLPHVSDAGQPIGMQCTVQGVHKVSLQFKKIIKK